MSLFIISSDWRFKEHFKHHFNHRFLHEFTIAKKLLDTLTSTQEAPQLIIIDERISNGTQQSLLEQLAYQKCTIPLLLFSSNPHWNPNQEFKTLKVYILPRKKVNYSSLLEQLDNQLQVKEQDNPYVYCPLIGKSKVMQRVRRKLQHFAKERCSVHLYGETGTGKELAATYLHNLSFPHKNIIPVNCSLLSTSLGNSMFFGHTKGAYTDGKSELAGIVQEAHQSTLFLDEVENLSLDSQAYMLRLLENGQYRRWGDTQLHTSHFRLVTASNEELSTLVEENRIRKDFYYRINEVSISLPPLREHLEDIPLLCEHYLSLCKEEKPLAEESMTILQSYHWPGNVRQLFSTIRRCLITSREELVVRITPDDIYLN